MGKWRRVIVVENAWHKGVYDMIISEAFGVRFGWIPTIPNSDAFNRHK